MAIARSGWSILLASLLLAQPALADGPSVSYSRTPDGDSSDCGSLPFDGTYTFDFGAGGNCTAGSDCALDVTSNADGGNSIVDTTIVACEIGATAGSQIGASGSSLTFTKNNPGSGTFNVTCNPSGSNAVARLCCTEARAAGGNDYPYFDISCPLTQQPEFESTPAGSTPISLSATVGQSDQATVTVTNSGAGTLTASASGLSNPLSVSPSGAQNAPATFTITCAPTSASGQTQTLTLDTNDADEDPVTYSVTCSGVAPPPDPEPELVPSPSTSTTLVISTTQPFQGSTAFSLTNAGDANLVVTAIAGADAPFSLSATSATIGSGQTTTFTVFCDGSSAGPFSDTLTIFSNDDDESQVSYNVNCFVSSQPLAEFSPSVEPRGPITLATTQGSSVQASLLVANSGNADLQVASASLTGDAQLSVSPPSAVVPQQSQQSFTITCNAASEGTFAGTLAFATNDTDEPSVEYDVTCGVQVAPAPELDSSPVAGTTLSIATTQGVDGTAQVAISNIGNQQLNIVSATGLSSPFSVSPTSASINAGFSQTFTVTCSGASTGTFNNGGTPLALTTTDDSEPVVLFPVSCSVAAPVVPEYESTPVAGGALVVNTTFGTDATATLKVTNTGNGTLTTSLSGLSSPFSVLPTAASIAPGASVNFFVTCSGATSGSFANGGVPLTVASNDSTEASNTYPVSCNVVELPPELDADPAPLAATIELETSLGIPVTAQIEVSNVGPAGAGSLDLTTSGLSGALSVTPTTAAVAKDGSQMLTVTCLPTLAGTFTQTLAIGSDDDDENPIRYNVRCVAFAPEYASAPVADATVTITTARGQDGTASVRVTNPTTGAGDLQITASGLSGQLSVSPTTTTTIPPPQIPPTVTFAPEAASTVTLTGGTATIVATSNADGSGSAAAASTTTVGSCSITGAGAGAFGAVQLTPSPITFVSRTAATGSIALTCTRAVGAQSATLGCSETPGVNAALPRSWPLVCPAL